VLQSESEGACVSVSWIHGLWAEVWWYPIKYIISCSTFVDVNKMLKWMQITNDIGNVFCEEILAS
jgi:hypothetical protein